MPCWAAPTSDRCRPTTRVRLRCGGARRTLAGPTIRVAAPPPIRQPMQSEHVPVPSVSDLSDLSDLSELTQWVEVPRVLRGAGVARVAQVVLIRPRRRVSVDFRALHGALVKFIRYSFGIQQPTPRIALRCVPARSDAAPTSSARQDRSFVA